MKNSIVENDLFFIKNFKIQVKIKHPSTIPIIIIPPKKSPEIFIPSETSANLKIKIVKSAMDKIPNKNVSFLSVINSEATVLIIVDPW